MGTVKDELDKIVYKHIRLDTNEIFYIGIGSNTKRAYYKYNRNKYWHNIVDKVGYSVEIITHCDTWEEACQIESYLISYYGRKDLGLGSLVNMTDGGDGMIGHKHTEESKKKMSELRIGQTLSEETKVKISEARKGHKHSEETKAKLSESKKNLPESFRQKMSEINKGRIHTEESKLNMSKGKKGMPSPNKGKKMSEEQKAKISETKKRRNPTVVQGVLDTQTGVFYNSIEEASFYYDIKNTTLRAMLTGQNPNKTNLIII